MSSKVFNKFDRLASQSEIKRGTKDAIDWFRKRVRKDLTTFRKTEDGLTPAKFTKGEMIMYQYDPKHKDSLPVYDQFPLIILLDKTDDGWYGANLHYLPPQLRAQLLKELSHRKANFAKIARSLEKNDLTKRCLKRYLADHVVTKPKSVPKKDWEIAVFLPFEGFVKQSAKTVWRKSK